VHVYLEGDGLAYITPTHLAKNPGRGSLLALQLMQLDPAPSLYVQRPCYGFNQLPSACHPALWSSARYSSTQVDALDKALSDAKQRLGQPERPLILIGHSGGATLALLLAHKRQDIQGLITLAGNLDPDAWTRHHHYSPLQGSHNPASLGSLPSRLWREHWFGADDATIPPALMLPHCQQDPKARCAVLPEATHLRGWHNFWAQRLRQPPFQN
jgi:hypothetical protein